MAIAIISSWLADPNRSYDHGRALYEQFGTDVLILALLKGGSSPYHFDRLVRALEELNPTLQEKTSKPALKQIPELSSFADPAVVAVTSKPEYRSLPDAIKEVTNLKNQHKRRADQLYIEIAFTESEELRLEMALTMLDDYEKVQECWSIIDNYRETGAVLESKTPTLEQEVLGMTLMQLIKNQKNIRTYLTKDRKAIEGMPEGRHKAKVSARIQENALRLELIDRRLKHELV